MRLTLALVLLAGPAFAGVDEAIDDHILPGTRAFAAGTADLAGAAEQDCTAEALKKPWNAAFDAWLGIQHLRFGPLEEEGRGLAIAFWPDTRGMVQRTVAGLLADEDPIANEPEEFGDVSVAGRGLFALERLLYEPGIAGYAPGSYPCTLATAMAVDLARMGEAIDTEWRDETAPALRHPGEGGSPYQTPKEAAQQLFTVLMTGLEFVQDQRLGRPMGTFDRPRPERAEARRSGRTLRNVVLSLEALRDFARALAVGPIPATEEAFEQALGAARGLEDPTLSNVADTQARFETEVVQNRISTARQAVADEIGVPLGVSKGFNSTDGD